MNEEYVKQFMDRLRASNDDDALAHELIDSLNEAVKRLDEEQKIRIAKRQDTEDLLNRMKTYLTTYYSDYPYLLTDLDKVTPDAFMQTLDDTVKGLDNARRLFDTSTPITFDDFLKSILGDMN